MTCYHPLKAFDTGRKTKNGRIAYKITGYDAKCIVTDDGEHWDVLGFIPEHSAKRSRLVREAINIPCGQCIGCRMRRAREWATRCMLEASYHDSSYFITLTYDQFHVPVNEYVDDDGVIQIKSTLVKSDLQKFWKRLRKDQDIRYYACGEYGTRTARPHYHAIVFGLKLDDLVEYKHTRAGTLYISPYLEKKWGKGYTVVGEVTRDSCEYVARYCMKKLTGKNANVYDRYNFLPEFSSMSLKPAIGREWFDDHFPEIYPADEIQLKDGVVVTPPRYFDRLMDNIDEELMDKVRGEREEAAKLLSRARMVETTLSEKAYLEVQERNMKAKMRKLVRPLE